MAESNLLSTSDGKSPIGDIQDHRTHNERRVGEQVQEQNDSRVGEQGENQLQELSEGRVDPFSSPLKARTNDLIRIIQTDYGLLDELESKHILTSHQVDLIQVRGTHEDRARQLLTEICQASSPAEIKEQVLRSLDNTQQKHVSNYIQNNGKRVAEFEEDWPLLLCCNEIKQLTENKTKLIELIDPKNGLLGEMFSAGCINGQMKQSVEKHVTDTEKNKQLFSILSRGSLATYNKFIRCLLDTKQPQVAYLLAPSQVAEIRPLSDITQNRIQTLYGTLVRCITLQSGLIAELYASDCITRRQKEYIESATGESNSIERLIETMARGSETDFGKFITSLKKTGQGYVSRILTEDGAFAQIIATFSPAISKESEEHIVDVLNEFLLAKLLSDTAKERRDELRAKISDYSLLRVKQLVNELDEKYKVTLLSAELGHSIQLTYFTTSLQGLQYLHDIFSTGHLKLMMQEIFIMLSNTADTVADMHVDTFRWDLSNFSECLQQLSHSTSRWIFSRVFEFAKQDENLSFRRPTNLRSIPIYEDHKENERVRAQLEDRNEARAKPSDSMDEFSSFIKKGENYLINLLTTRFGLLDQLVNNNVLTATQVSIIQATDSHIGELKQLLKEITKEILSNDKKEAFLSALDQSQQKHVSNWIRGEGKWAAEFGEIWPLYCYTEEFQKLTASRGTFIDLIDTRSGLLDEMLLVHCISMQQIHSIMKDGIDEVEHSCRLLEIITRGSLATYHAFVRCLVLTKQHRIAYLLKPTSVGDMRPLSDEQYSRVMNKYSNLVDSIDLDVGFLDKLLAADCITWLQRDSIDSAHSKLEGNKRLLDIVSRGSEANYHKFIKCLEGNGHHDVRSILCADAVHYRPTTASEDELRGESERISRLLCEISDEIHERHPALSYDELRERLTNKIKQQISQLFEKEILKFLSLR